MRCLKGADDAEVLAGFFGDEVGLIGGYRGVVYEVCAYAEGGGAGVEEVGGGGEGDAACGDEFDLGEGSFEGAEVGGAAEGVGREDFDHDCAGLPGCDVFVGVRAPGRTGIE